MRRARTSLLVGMGSLILVAVWLLGVASAQQPAPTYPLDDKLANEPAPWTVKGKWGARGNWGRWGEEDKRGMLNVHHPRDDRQSRGISEAGQGVCPRGGAA